MTLAPSTVARIRELLAKATPGPWKHESSWGFDPAIWWASGGLIADVHSSDGEVTFPAQDNAALIVELVNSADALLAAAEAGAWRPTRKEVLKAVDDATFNAMRIADLARIADAILALFPPTPEAKP